MSFVRTSLARAALVAVAGAVVTFAAAGGAGAARGDDQLQKIDHVVVIYEENHSFDNLYGGWEGVNGIGGPGYAAHSTQVSQAGTALTCTPQYDVNLKVPPLSKVCSGTDKNGNLFDSHFVNGPFKIDDFIKASDKTCPSPTATTFAPNGVVKDSAGALAGGCTRDIVHRFYQEQFQFDGGNQDKYV